MKPLNSSNELIFIDHPLNFVGIEDFDLQENLFEAQ
jgi:hypothetical protein